MSPVRRSKERSKEPIFKMTEEQYRALRDEDGGLCLDCEEPAFGIEPDAREYVCESCDAAKVYGAEELLLMGHIELKG